MKIVIVTACPCGSAHSVMTAEALRKEAQNLGYEVWIEEQGGFQNPQRLDEQTIADADVVIIAAAIIISGKERFQDKKILDVPIKDALMRPKETLLRAVELAKKS